MILLFFGVISLVSSDSLLVDHKLSIERIIRLNSEEKFLTLDFELEQGVLGERVQEDKLAYIPKNSKLHYFDHVSILADVKQLTERTEAALRLDNEEVVAVRRRYNGIIPCDVRYSFPFESFECRLRIVAEKAKDEFDIRWAYRKLVTPPTTGSFKITSAVLSTCFYERAIPSAESATSTNELHGCLEFILTLERSLYVAMFRYFAPTTIILLMSWLAFYQRRDKSNIRFIIFCACSLIETIIVLNYLNSSPAAASLTPADNWALLLCINYSVVVFFLFLISLFEAKAAKFHKLIDDPSSIRKSSLNRYQKEANKHLLYEKKDMEQSQCSNYDDVINTVFRKKADSAALTSTHLRLDRVYRSETNVMDNHGKTKFVDYLPPNFVFSVKDPFYYGPVTFNLLHYSTAAAICGVLEFLVSSVISTALWYYFNWRKAIEGWLVVAAISLTVVSLLSTGALFIGISHHKAKLLNPKLILIQIQTTLLMIIASISIVLMCFGLEMTNMVFGYFIHVPTMERDFGTIWPLIISIAAFFAALMQIWMRAIIDGAENYFLDKEYFEGRQNQEMKVTKHTNTDDNEY